MQVLRILTGQTASGKENVAVSLARREPLEIVSVDSMKVYRGLDIGTAKPSHRVREEVVFHLIDVVEPQETFTLVRFIEAAREAVADIERRGRVPLHVGGTPLYLRGLVYGVFDAPDADWALRETLLARAQREGNAVLHEELRRVDPVAAERLHPNDLKRVVRALEVAELTGRPISEQQTQYPAARPAAAYRMVALRRGEEDLRQRINDRIDRMIEAGLTDELRRVLREGALSRTAGKAIGYREIGRHLKGELPLSQAVEEIRRRSWRFARKQMTWFKSFPDVCWLDVARDEPAEETAARVRAIFFGAHHLN